MFLPNSRYAHVAAVETTTPGGERVLALKLRRLAPVEGVPHLVQSGDRLDLLAWDRVHDATQFWHVGDANSALDGRTLVAVPGATMLVPKE
jgi:hypothetical protein